MARNTAITKYTSRVMQREVERQNQLMDAKGEVGKTVIDVGTEIQNYAATKIVEAARYDEMMLDAAQNLNGSAQSTAEKIRELNSDHGIFIIDCGRLCMRSLLEQGSQMPVVPEKGLITRIGDGIAELRDEVDRSKAR